MASRMLSLGKGLSAAAVRGSPMLRLHAALPEGSIGISALRLMSTGMSSTTSQSAASTSAASIGPIPGLPLGAPPTSDSPPHSSPSSTSSDLPPPHSSASATAGVSPEELAKRVLASLRSGYESTKSRINGGSRADGGAGAGTSGSAAGATPDSAFMAALRGLAQDVRATVLPSQDIGTATCMYTGALMPEAGPYDGPAALTVVKQKASAWQTAWEAAVHRVPVLSRLGSVKVQNTAAYKKGQEVAEDLREKWETSDHPAVHKVEDLKERVFSGSESSRAMGEIRTRDPSFDINTFAKSVKQDGTPVVSAFLRHDMETLKLHCGPELLERFAGIFKHFNEQGLSEDPTIMFTGDVEIVEVRMVDGDPWIIAQFHCQQLKCTKDKFGNVVEGSMDSIQRVYYFWGLQQEKGGVVTAEGKVLAPRWVIKDMMWQSMLALV